MNKQFNRVYPILLAGGTGTRLWPVSRQLYPKQLVKFIGEDSLVQATIKRLIPLLDAEKIRIVCGKEHVHQTARHIEEIGIAARGKIISEPCGRNTAPAILLSVFHVLKKEKEAILCIFPADHVIKDVKGFHANLESAIRLAESGYVVTFGIRPHYPETGYGYIEGAAEVAESALKIKRFVEKPDLKTAQDYLKAGNFFWNSGMFAFKASVILAEFKRHQTELFERMEKMMVPKNAVTMEAYQQIPDISIDYAIMEKTAKGVVLPSEFGWSDIGSWKSLYEFLPKGDYNNVIDGDVIARNTENSFILGRDRLIATNHIKNMVVVETPDSIFVSDLDNSRDVKSIVENLQARGRWEYRQHTTVNHPWGNTTILEQENDYTVQRFIVYPGSSSAMIEDTLKIKHLSVISGDGRIESSAGKRILKKGETTIISEKGTVKIRNIGEDPLCIIAVEMRV
ncbi:MAG: mannose-1-phosphate guanylyltransferase/mannose-6-phosphate isomerase [Deltaproteobacteria bacterium]|nr:MAG: mannose-1-phosphate guanylyltransferase/mannose-6-phosphate isomerase [Deltaproteobacteria bacterium]